MLKGGSPQSRTLAATEPFAALAARYKPFSACYRALLLSARECFATEAHTARYRTFSALTARYAAFFCSLQSLVSMCYRMCRHRTTCCSLQSLCQHLPLAAEPLSASYRELLLGVGTGLGCNDLPTCQARYWGGPWSWIGRPWFGRSWRRGRRVGLLKSATFPPF